MKRLSHPTESPNRTAHLAQARRPIISTDTNWTRTFRRSTSSSSPQEPTRPAPASNKPDSAMADGDAALRALGYKFENDRLVKLDGSPSEFEVKPGDRLYNQTHYEAIGAATTELIVNRLQSEFGLRKETVPIDTAAGEPTSFILMSPDALSSSEPLLLLLPGIAIQVGQWARKIVINESLRRGSMMEYVGRATAAGYNVIIFNSNMNHVENRSIRGSESPEAHVAYVWDTFVKPAAASDIAIVAHSYGGECTARLLESRESEVRDRVRGIAFTDSVHVPRRRGALLQSLAVNWVRSDAPLGKNLGRDGAGVQLFSAGTTSHDQTTVVAADEVFKFLGSRLD
ncbi:Arb2 domain-containing protein [Zopfochytrium polystomum]|nr:Arb2 domain-containing protein [Zopfochytrium polystomum]